MTASECVSALRYALWHVTRLRGLSWADRIAVGLLKFVAIAGYHYGKWRTLGVAPPRRPDAAVSRKALEPLIHTALNGCEPGGSSNNRPRGVSVASPRCRRRLRQLGGSRCHLRPRSTSPRPCQISCEDSPAACPLRLPANEIPRGRDTCTGCNAGGPIARPVLPPSHSVPLMFIRAKLVIRRQFLRAVASTGMMFCSPAGTPW
jgi:hypothetical protein